jgi:hypothetical protein
MRNAREKVLPRNPDERENLRDLGIAGMYSN